MADPFSIACGVVGIVSLADVVYTLGSRFLHDCKDSPAELKALVSEIYSLKGVLEALHLLIEDARSEDLRMVAPNSLAFGRRPSCGICVLC